MRGGAFARSLPDFAREAGRPPADFEVAIPAPPPAPVDPAMMIAEAHERGLREGAAAALASFEQQRAADAALHAERIAEERRRWTEEEGDRLATAMSAGLARIEAGLADGVARILQPFVTEQVRRSAVDDLARTLTGLLADGGAPVMLVRGPPDLLERLRPRLSTVQAAVTFEETASADILVTIGETIVETQIAAWLGRLAAAVE